LERSQQRLRCCCSEGNEEAAMSIAKKAGLLVAVIGIVATVATAAEGGEGKRYRSSYYVVEAPVRVVRPSVVYVAPPQPVVYAPVPVYYEPVYAAPAYPSLNINIPLR
jgi:hypothetical protein